MDESVVMTLVVATRNLGKMAEIRAALAGLPIEVVTTEDVWKTAPEIEETGQTFVDNACIKARTVASATQLLTLADDSGLEVDALGGQPGVRSARYAREGATDAENNAKLLAALQEVGDGHRTARFRCVMAIIDPFGGLDDSGDAPILCEGTCEGTIARQGQGSGGFGFDPLFVVDGLTRTFAELSEAEKLERSHRGKALIAVRATLEKLVQKRVFEAHALLARGPEGAS